MKLINKHLEGRKDLNKVILKYYSILSFKNNREKDPADEFIDKKVVIDDNLKGNRNLAHRDSELDLNTIKKSKSLNFSLLKTRKARSKTHFPNDNQ